MKIQVKTQSWSELKVANLVLPLFEGQESETEAVLKKILKKNDKQISSLLSGTLTGKAGFIESQLLVQPASVERLIFIGMGKVKDFDLKKVRTAVAKLIQWSNARQINQLCTMLLKPENSPLTDDAVWHTQIVAAQMSVFNYKEFKSDSRPDPLKTLTLFTPEVKQAAALRKLTRHAEAYGDAVNLARELVIKPGNVATPAYLAATARRFKKNGVKVTVLDAARLGREKCGGILAVGQGSRNKPNMITMEYACGRKKAPTVALVGKGVTFDSGGISLKPGAGMDEMKGDMGGAAAVLAVFSVLHRIKPAVNVIGIVPAAENMPDGASYRPGDIIRCHSGKTVEILNTDAEGRLLLADGLSWAEQKYKPQAILDIATLTGAVVVALAHEFTGLLTNSNDLAEQVLASGAESGDPAWQLPLTAEFEEMVKSDVADLRNSVPGRAGGTITAAAFLKAHLRDTPWAHLDIAGTSWKKSKSAHSGPQGAAVRLLLNLLENFHIPTS